MSNQDECPQGGAICKPVIEHGVRLKNLEHEVTSIHDTLLRMDKKISNGLTADMNMVKQEMAQSRVYFRVALAVLTGVIGAKWGGWL